MIDILNLPIAHRVALMGVAAMFALAVAYDLFFRKEAEKRWK